ncbi:MAG: hypothetical protein L0H93_20510 [Nocardioides sp.]|nr:hypothetical protein [Nocardioides sp.]
MKLIPALAAGTATLALVALPSAAQAVELTAENDASGTTHIASTNSDIELKPTTLTTTVDMTTSEITGHLPLVSTQTEFKVLGFVPVSATVNFDEAAPVTGKLGRGRVDTTASYYIRLSNVKIAGVPTYVTNHCQTKKPVTIAASTPEGGTFNLNDGGPLTGEYTIGDFEHCFINAPLINAIVPGSGNTVDIDVSNGRLG